MSIETDTPILPYVIAENVKRELEQYFQMEFGEACEDHLVNRAETVYSNNKDFAKKICSKGNTGRDMLYVFMRHWMARWIKDTYGDSLFSRLPYRYWAGEKPTQLVEPRAE
jgi:hypothetical protein